MIASNTPIAPPQEHDATPRSRMSDLAPQPGRGEPEDDIEALIWAEEQERKL